jgi:hypothetical protein
MLSTPETVTPLETSHNSIIFGVKLKMSHCLRYIHSYDDDCVYKPERRMCPVIRKKPFSEVTFLA